MKIQGINPETGEEYQSEANLNDSFIESMLNFDMSDEQIKKVIDNLNVSADVKSLLYAISKATIKAGQFVLKIGRKIIDFVCLIFKEFPNATFGLIFGAIAGWNSVKKSNNCAQLTLKYVLINACDWIVSLKS